MLHIVQVVISGSAKLPKLFIEKSKAESAYVEHTKDAWAESYSAYCEQLESNHVVYEVKGS